MNREETMERIAELRRRAASVREGSAYADSRQAREADLNYAARLEAEARTLERQLREAAE